MAQKSLLDAVVEHYKRKSRKRVQGTSGGKFRPDGKYGSAVVRG